SQRSVCLIGASTLAVATRLWDLPDDQQRIVHNLAIPSTCHTMHLQILKYLIDYKDLLRAGPDKTLVVLGVTYHCALCKDGPHVPFVASATKYGHSAYDRPLGLRPGPAHAMLQWVRTERSRIPVFLRRCLELAVVHVKMALYIAPGPPLRQH